MVETALRAQSVRVRVPAKLNLALRVGPRGDDGYHPLATVFHAVSLYDEVVASPAEPGTISLHVSGEGASDVPADSRNLAWQAAQLLADTYGSRAPRHGRRRAAAQLGVRLTIRKAIPVAGGMAGGSGDGAAALLACAVLWDLDADPDDLHELAAQLGSDVPFALVGGTAIGCGRGDRLIPVLSRGCFHWVVVLSEHGLATPDVYRRFDERAQASGPLEVPRPVVDALATGDARALGAALDNDLQEPALDLLPELRHTLAAGHAAGAIGALVSGSGPTCAFLAADESSAVDLSARLSSLGVGKAIRRVAGPVPGARLIS